MRWADCGRHRRHPAASISPLSPIPPAAAAAAASRRRRDVTCAGASGGGLERSLRSSIYNVLHPTFGDAYNDGTHASPTAPICLCPDRRPTQLRAELFSGRRRLWRSRDGCGRDGRGRDGRRRMGVLAPVPTLDSVALCRAPHGSRRGRLNPRHGLGRSSRDPHVGRQRRRGARDGELPGEQRDDRQYEDASRDVPPPDPGGQRAAFHPFLSQLASGFRCYSPPPPTDGLFSPAHDHECQL